MSLTWIVSAALPLNGAMPGATAASTYPARLVEPQIVRLEPLFFGRHRARLRRVFERSIIVNREVAMTCRNSSNE